MEFKATIVYQKTWDAINKRLADGSRKYRYIIHTGSSRSSKTVSLIDVYDTYARSNRGKRMTVWRDTKTDCKKTVLNDALKRFKSTNRYKVNQDFNKTESVFTYDTDSTFEIHGTDDEETVHGLTQDCAWFNEPYKISKDTFDQIDQRTSDFVFIDWNPKKDHFIDDLVKDPRTLVIHSTFRDNPFCPEEQKKKILSYQSVKYSDVVVSGLISKEAAVKYDTEENTFLFTERQLKELRRCRLNEEIKTASDIKWLIYGLGTKAERPNRIFHWERISDADYRAINQKVYYGVDWGAVDPMGILEAKYYDGALYFHQLNYLSENKIREKLTPTEIKQIENDDDGLIKWFFARLGLDKSRITVCDNNRPLKIRALRKIGFDYAIEAVKGAGSIIDGIDLLNDLRIFVTESSADMHYEEENYSRKVDKYGIVLEEPEDLNNHLIDPARYIAQRLVAEGIIRQ